MLQLCLRPFRLFHFFHLHGVITVLELSFVTQLHKWKDGLRKVEGWMRVEKEKKMVGNYKKYNTYNMVQGIWHWNILTAFVVMTCLIWQYLICSRIIVYGFKVCLKLLVI